MSLKNRFAAEDLERIKSAVRKAEEKISGEIVPVFVERSGYYSIANYRGAMIAAAIVFLVIIVVDRYIPDLAIYDPLYFRRCCTGRTPWGHRDPRHRTIEACHAEP